jgi:hypothetical protein
MPTTPSLVQTPQLTPEEMATLTFQFQPVEVPRPSPGEWHPNADLKDTLLALTGEPMFDRWGGINE